MEGERDSKEYSWKWVTADELLSKGVCDFVSAIIFPTGTGTCNATLYNGEDSNGEIIFKYSSPTDRVTPVKPQKPLFCDRGLYLGGTSILDGILIQWRERKHEEGSR